jgi:hypothetical protein
MDEILQCKKCHLFYPKDELHKCKQPNLKTDTLSEPAPKIYCRECHKELDIAEELLYGSLCKRCSTGGRDNEI